MQVACGVARATPCWGNNFDQIAYSGCINRKTQEMVQLIFMTP